jgi:hypothetical protein
MSAFAKHRATKINLKSAVRGPKNAKSANQEVKTRVILALMRAML